MHPQVVQNEPGSCPICGMALEPRDVGVDADAPNPDLVDMTRRLRLAAVFTIPLIFIAMGDLLPGEPTSRVLLPRAYSIVAAIAPQIFPESFRDAGGQVAVYFEAAGVIVTLILLGQVLELRARRAMSFGSVSVIANSLRLRGVEL